MTDQPAGVRWSTLIYIVIVSALGGLLFGFDSGVISGCEKGMQKEYFPVMAQKAEMIGTAKDALAEAEKSKDEAKIAECQAKLTEVENTKLEGEDSANFWHGFTVSVALIGTLIGAFGVGRPSDRWGRRNILVLMAILYFISAVGSAFPPNWISLVIFRFIGGVAIGGSSVVVPLYI
nr:MFS transporter [Thermoguttaceae bacterium]